MPNKPGKPGNVFYIVFVGVPISAMLIYGVYIYYYHDYGDFVSPEFHKNEPPSGSSLTNGTGPAVPVQAPVAKLAAVVRLTPVTLSVSEVSDAHKLVLAELLITNDGAASVRILYTPWPSSLIEPQVDYLGPDGKAKPEKIDIPRDALPPVPPHDPRAPKPIRFFLAYLNPGEKLSIPVALNPPLDLSRPGKYSLHVQYDPSTFCRQMALNAIALGVYSHPLQTPAVEFEVVGAKTPPAEKSAESAKAAAAP
ncbi:MAG: hypothetical protein HY291_05320 [Planctomycetes bacterium]|nr:hypothetical protein [Planctomycetota bacterium]